MASRLKRPSFKGKGADIFFTGEAPTATEPTPEEGPAEGSKSESKLASLPANKQARKPAREKASTLAGNLERLPDAASDIEILVAETALDQIAAQGRITASFRFSEAELDALDDAVTEVKKKHRVRIAKQELVRLGLATLLSDYRERGKKSVLGLYIEREKELRKRR